MRFNFDEITERRNTDSIKYDFAAERGKPEGILPLWVADMDFSAPPAVIEALVNKSRHGIFGYSESGADYFAVLHNWFLQNFNWELREEWLIKTPGVVNAICCAIRALTKKGEAVVIQEPVYYPFSQSILLNERKLIVNRLLYAEGRYSIDFTDFEKQIVANKVKMFVLCSPHNPVGRVWKKEELLRLGEICCRHGVIVISDEIHADFVYPGHRHLVFAQLEPEFAEIAVTCTAPTKTFNLAGLQISNIFISNQEIGDLFRQEIVQSGLSHPNIMGITACKAAYEKGGTWLRELKMYLCSNLAFVRSFLAEKLPQVKLVEPEGTYLVWLDFQELGLSVSELDDLITNKAGLWLDCGTMFGAGGEGFQRINIACPRPILEKACTQLAKAVETILNK